MSSPEGIESLSEEKSSIDENPFPLCINLDLFTAYKSAF
jgi:hypothetical protein